MGMTHARAYRHIAHRFHESFLSWRKANGYVGWFISISLRNPKLTLSISTFYQKPRKRRCRFRITR